MTTLTTTPVSLYSQQNVRIISCIYFILALQVGVARNQKSPVIATVTGLFLFCAELVFFRFYAGPKMDIYWVISPFYNNILHRAG